MKIHLDAIVALFLIATTSGFFPMSVICSTLNLVCCVTSEPLIEDGYETVCF